MQDFRFIEDGITYHVVATYYDAEYTKKNYMIYTDNTLKDGKLRLYYSIYEEYPNNKIKLLNMTNQAEEKVGLSFLKTILEEMEKPNA